MSFLVILSTEESLIPELVAILGPQNFVVLVQYFGGHTLAIPKASTILQKVNNDND